jgi:hypothetical protein
MLETLSLINTWIWNIIGIIIGLPLVLSVCGSILFAVIAFIASLFVVGKRK